MGLSEFCEQEYKDFLTRNKICSIFCIAYHPIHLEVIKPHLIEVLKKYGGWIGTDSDGFYPYYTLEDIDNLS